MFLLYFKDCISFIFLKGPFVCYSICIKKYLFTCCEILTDDERKVRNIFYHALHCTFLCFDEIRTFQSFDNRQKFIKHIYVKHIYLLLNRVTVSFSGSLFQDRVYIPFFNSQILYRGRGSASHQNVGWTGECSEGKMGVSGCAP